MGKKQEMVRSRVAAGTAEGTEKGETRGRHLDDKEGGGAAGRVQKQEGRERDRGVIGGEGLDSDRL